MVYVVLFILLSPLHPPHPVWGHLHPCDTIWVEDYHPLVVLGHVWHGRPGGGVSSVDQHQQS